MTSKALVTSFHGPAETLREATSPAMHGYARRHGYDVLEAPVIGGLPASWASIPALRAALDDHDLAVWIDADALILDPRHDIASALDGSWHFFAHDPRVGSVAWLWGLRRGNDATSLLDRVWARRNQDFGRAWEQGAIHAELNEPTLIGEPWVDRYGMLRSGVRFGHASSQVGTWEQRRQHLLGLPIVRPLIPSTGTPRTLPGPYDCSGAVSALLMRSGLLEHPLLAGEFLGWGEPGIGPLTVWANEAHVFAELLVNGEWRHFGTDDGRIGCHTKLHDHAGFEPRRPSR